MALTMDEMRARIKARKEQQESQSNGTGGGERKPDAFLAHWNIPTGSTLNFRFLPDADNNNDFFWREREMITLYFNGIKGEAGSREVKFQVPCNEMFTPGVVNTCPVHKVLREMYATKDPEQAKIASRYWKKRTWLMQGFIAPGSAAVKDDVAPENPIRRVLLNKDLFEKVESILSNERMVYLPFDFEHGRDFAISKTTNGSGHASYNTSAWDMYERPLSPEERAAIEKYQLFDLKEFIPKQPNEEELNAIYEMFIASMAGEMYDPERWAMYYRPAGVQRPESGSTSTSTYAQSTGGIAVPQHVAAQQQQQVAQSQQFVQQPIQTEAQQFVQQPAQQFVQQQTNVQQPVHLTEAVQPTATQAAQTVQQSTAQNSGTMSPEELMRNLGLV